MHDQDVHDIQRLRSLRATLNEIEITSKGTTASPDDNEAGVRSAIEQIEQAWPDDKVIEAYQATDRRPGEVQTDAIVSELRHRGLDVEQPS